MTGPSVQAQAGSQPCWPGPLPLLQALVIPSSHTVPSLLYLCTSLFLKISPMAVIFHVPERSLQQAMELRVRNNSQVVNPSVLNLSFH